MRTAIGSGLIGIFAGVLLGQQMPQQSIRHMPDDMYYTAPSERLVSLYAIGDDRYQDVPVVMSPRDTPEAQYLCTEGDQIVGQADAIVRLNLARLAATARLIDPDQPQIAATLAGGRRELLEAMRRYRPVDADDARTQRYIAESRIGPWTNTTIALIARVAGKMDLPQDLVVAAANVQPVAKGVGIIGQQYRWPGGIVPYVIRVQGLPIPQAIADWNTKQDRIRLRPYRQGDVAWVEFVASSGCSSYIGKSVARGAQPIMLANGCLLDQIVHEIGHAVGLFHEQSRIDRDRYLIIQPQNIQAGTESNFAQVRLGQAQDINAFDFTSVMLYGPDAFSATGQPTMVARNPAVGMNWGINHRQKAGLRGLSKTDVQSIAQMYPERAKVD